MDERSWKVIEQAFGKIAQKAIASKKTKTRKAAHVLANAREIRDTVKALIETLAVLEATEQKDNS